MKKFEDGFLFGAATSAHQTEGNNIHSDYWLMENMKYTDFNEKSGLAVDHYNRYREDIDLLKKAGLNAYRFSIEWAVFCCIAKARGIDHCSHRFFVFVQYSKSDAEGGETLAKYICSINRV